MSQEFLNNHRVAQAFACVVEKAGNKPDKKTVMQALDTAGMQFNLSPAESEMLKKMIFEDENVFYISEK